ncbi:MAG: DUF5106 domain-containing protein [Paludibacteraceae bacterium]|nr:DUF5106 domain-containing protein [Paludibacteraceae bacterium]
MKRLFLILAALSLSALVSAASSGYKIQLSVKNMKNDKAYLAYHMNGKTYSRDTLSLDAKGNGAFTGKKNLEEGIYIIYFNAEKYFDLMVGADQNIKISVDTTDLDGAVVTGAAESAQFQDLRKFLIKMNTERIDLQKKYKEKKIDSTAFYDTFDKMTDKVMKFQNDLIDRNKGNFLGAYVKGTIPVETPEFTELPDSIRNRVRYQYFKQHYFDNVNLSDQRFLRTPFFPSMVDGFISRHVLQDPDTLAAAAIDLIERSKGDTLTFQVMTSKMINYGISSKMMGMDKLWLKLADKYYFSGQAKWADSAWVESLRKEAKKIRYNLVGDDGQMITMRDSTSRIVKLSDVKAECVLVYFFEPSCGHCKKTTPILHDSVYVKWKDKGFEVFACYTQTDRKEWMDFVNKNHMQDWLNVWDPYRESFFWEYYDTSATPGVYLLNKDRKIIAKKIDMNTLDMILNEELVKRKQPKK